VSGAHAMREEAPRGRSRRWRRVRRTLLPAVLVVSGVLASAAASATLSDKAPAPAELEQHLQDQIDAMRAAGLPASDPKVRALQATLDQMRATSRIRPQRDPQGDAGALLAEAGEQQADPRAAAAEAAAEGEPLWESGPVDCEPVPGLLSADELAGATCVSVPQPDGTSRFVALGADGVARIVLFGADGHVQRLPDTRLPAGLAPGTAVTPTPQGDLELAPPGRQPTFLDLR
jgi:hypothetical protein